METTGKPRRRQYNAPQREAAAARTREAIVRSAKRAFTESGWPGTTVRSIASSAGVSPKTVEALFGTKGGLLRAVVDFSIRGDVHDVPIDRREAVAMMDAASSVSEMLDLHAMHVRGISERTAGVAWVIEHAAPSDPDVAALWEVMTKNRRTGVRWATRTVLAKPDADSSLRVDDVENTFWVALEWGTYRSLTEQRGLTATAFERWLRAYYRRMLLA
jgi:TetR/AcrR family transcriptional regulator, regulator of autoinduction and epiphytic fitness